MLPAAQYPTQPIFGVPQANIWGTFNVPIGTAPGKWDLGVVVHGRPDSCLVPEAIDVLPPSPPRLTTFSPSQAYAETTLVTVGLFNVSEDVRQWKYSLRTGNSAIAGEYHSHGADWVSLRIMPDRTHPAGWYDFHAVMASGEAYTLPRSFRLLPPHIYVSQIAFPQGIDTTVRISLWGHGIPSMLPPAPGAWENRVNSCSIGLCRESSCLQAVELGLDTDDWQARFRIGRDFPTGVYDLEMLILEPDTSLRAARAIVVGPPAIGS